MKKISVIDLLLKRSETGKRIPSVWLWTLIILLVFSSYYFSQEKKVSAAPAKEPILKAKDIVEAANSPITVIPEKTGIETDITASHKQKVKKLFGSSNSKMIVYDATTEYKSEEIVPLGSMVKCILIHNIVTNNFDAPVIAQVWQDFYFKGKLLLPFGTRIYGVAFAGQQRDRVTVKFHTIVFQDGNTIKINAIGLSQDGSGGLTGTVIDNRNKHLFMRMALNFLSGMAAGLQDTATNAVTGITQVEQTSRNAILNGVANTFQKEAQRLEQDVENASGYAIILAGNELIIYFEKESDINPI